MLRISKTTSRHWELSQSAWRQNGANVAQDRAGQEGVVGGGAAGDVAANPAAAQDAATGGPPQQDEARWIQAALQGDSLAFGLLVHKYQDRLRTALLHICPSRDEAEDAAQEAFIQAYLKLHTFAGGSTFYTWLYRIAMNGAISRRRKRREEVSVERYREVAGAEPADDGEGADERLLREERAVQVRRALARLSLEHRTILVLREVEGCDYDAIAAILEVPVGTVRSRLHRARLQLKHQLDTVMGEADERG